MKWDFKATGRKARQEDGLSEAEESAPSPSYERSRRSAERERDCDNISNASTEEFAPPYASSGPSNERGEAAQAGPSQGFSSRGWSPPVSPLPSMGVPYWLTIEKRKFVTSKATVEMNGRIYTSGWQPTCWESTKTGPILEFSADGSVPPAPFRTVHFPKDYDVPRPRSPPVPGPNAFQMDFWIRDPEPAFIEEVFEEESSAPEPLPTQSDVLDVFTTRDDEMMGSPPENLIDLNGVPITPSSPEEPGTLDDATTNQPTPEDVDDEETLRQRALATTPQLRPEVSAQLLLGGVPPRPSYQPTLRRPRSKSPIARSRPSSTETSLPSVLKTKKTVTFVDLTENDEKRWDSDDEGAPTTSSSYPPLWRGDNGPAEPAEAKKTNEPPKRWRRADRRSKRAGVKRNRAAPRSPSAAGGSCTKTTGTLAATKNEQRCPPFGCCFRCWSYGHRYYQCPEPQMWAFCTKCGCRDETTTSCVQCNVATTSQPREERGSSVQREDRRGGRAASRSPPRARSRSRSGRRRPSTSRRSPSRQRRSASVSSNEGDRAQTAADVAHSLRDLPADVREQVWRDFIRDSKKKN